MRASFSHVESPFISVNGRSVDVVVAVCYDTDFDAHGFEIHGKGPIYSSIYVGDSRVDSRMFVLPDMIYIVSSFTCGEGYFPIQVRVPEFYEYSVKYCVFNRCFNSFESAEKYFEKMSRKTSIIPRFAIVDRVVADKWKNIDVGHVYVRYGISEEFEEVAQSLPWYPGKFLSRLLR